MYLFFGSEVTVSYSTKYVEGKYAPNTASAKQMSKIVSINRESGLEEHP
jgi:hypothetical protein